MSTTAMRTPAKVQSLRAHEIDGGDKAAGSQTHLARAVTLHLAGKREEALKQLQRAIAANEASAEIYRAMGHIQFELGNFEEAAKSYRILAQVKPQYAMGWFNLAVCLERAGGWEDAAQAFHRASTLDAGYVDAHLGLGVCHLRQEDPDAAGHQDGEARLQVFLVIGMLVVDRQLHGYAQRHAARNDGDLVQRVGIRYGSRHQRVARLVVRRIAFLGVAQDHGLALGAHQDFILGQLKVDHHDDFAVLTGGVQCGLVHQVGEVRARQSRRAAAQHGKVDVIAKGDLLGMHAQDRFAAPHVGKPHDHAAIETAGTEQGRIEHIGPVRGGHQDHAFIGFKTVHFNQQLVESLLALVVSAAQARAAMAADGVDFVDEDDAGSVLLALLEQVAHAAGAYAHEHLHEVRTGDGEERHAGLAGDGARQQRLAGAWRADQQHALGNTSAQLLKLLRLGQEFDDFLQLLLGLFHARDVPEGHLLLLWGMQARAALAEAERLVAAALHLPHHEDPERQQQDERRRLHQQREPWIGVGVLNLDFDAVLLQQIVNGRIVGGDERAQAFVVAHIHTVDFVAGDIHVPDLLVFDLIDEVGEGDLLLGGVFALVDDSPQKHY